MATALAALTVSAFPLIIFEEMRPKYPMIADHNLAI
jgi:hypothetical protein